MIADQSKIESIVDTEELILKFIEKGKETRIAKINFKKKSKIGKHTILF